MGTGAVWTNLVNKKILPLDQIKDGFLDYLRNRELEIHERLWNDDGSFDTLTLLTSPVNDQLSVSPLTPWAGASGNGYTLEDDGTSVYLLGVPFENTLGVLYHVGIHAVQVPDGVETNPRTGLVQYVQYKEEIGNVGNPDSVTDLGLTIRLVVDSITESGVSHAGRVVRVCLVNPLSDDPVVAFEECTVAWVAGQNVITTTGLLGQTVGSVSVILADYYVHEKGPTIQRFTSGDLRTVDGTLFLAAVTGSGPGAIVPPGNIDYTDQNVISASLIDISEIIRIDPHGHAKVQVRGCAADVDEDQITVLDPTSVRVFGVDEDGDMYVAGDIELDGVLEFTGFAPASGFTFTDYQVGEGSPPGVLVFNATGGIKSTWFIDLSGASVHSVALDGSLQFMGPTALIETTTYGSAQIAFQDVNALSPVYLSNNDLNWGNAPKTSFTDIIGSLNEQQSTSGHRFYNGVFYGMDVTMGGGNIVNIAAGSIYVAQNDKTDLRFAKQIKFIGGSMMMLDGVYFLYVDGNGSFATHFMPTIAYADGNVVLAEITTVAGVVTQIIDLRCFIGTGDVNTAVTVGYMASTATAPRFYNFMSLYSAMRFVDWRYNGGGAYNGIHPSAEIVINGPLYETQSIIVNTPGVRIRSSQKNGQNAVSWSFDGPLFTINGVSDVEIRDSWFVYAGPQSAGAGLVEFASLGAQVDRFRFLNNRVVDYNGLNFVIRGVFGIFGEVGYDFTIRDNFIWSQQQSLQPVDAALWFEWVERLHVENNFFNGASAPVTNLRYGVYLPGMASYCSVRGNMFRYWEKALIVPVANPDNLYFDTFCDNWVDLCLNGALDVQAFGAAFWKVDGNYFYSCRQSGVAANTVVMNAPGSTVTNNTAISNFANTALSYDYYIGGYECLVEGNESQFSDAGIQIAVAASDSVVVGNLIRQCQMSPALYDAGHDAVIADNYIEGWNQNATVNPGIGAQLSGYDSIFVGNRVTSSGTSDTYAVQTAATVNIDIIGNHIDVGGSNAVTGALALNLLHENGVVVGNDIGSVGNGISGGMGIVLAAGAGHISIVGNSFNDVRGHAMYFSMGSLPSAFNSNSVRDCGWPGILNPITTTIQLDSVWVAGGTQDHVICSNMIGTAVVGAWGVTLNVGSAGCISQLNRCVCPGGNVQDLAAANMIGANAVNNNL